MIATLTKIGNSRGVIIPARFLKECRFDGAVSISMRNNTIVISKPDQPRSGWSEAFAKASPIADALLIDDTLANDFDDSAWSW